MSRRDDQRTVVHRLVVLLTDTNTSLITRRHSGTPGRFPFSHVPRYRDYITGVRSFGIPDLRCKRKGRPPRFVVKYVTTRKYYLPTNRTPPLRRSPTSQYVRKFHHSLVRLKTSDHDLQKNSYLCRGFGTKCDGSQYSRPSLSGVTEEHGKTQSKTHVPDTCFLHGVRCRVTPLTPMYSK